MPGRPLARGNKMGKGRKRGLRDAIPRLRTITAEELEKNEQSYRRVLRRAMMKDPIRYGEFHAKLHGQIMPTTVIAQQMMAEYVPPETKMVISWVDPRTQVETPDEEHRRLMDARRPGVRQVCGHQPAVPLYDRRRASPEGACPARSGRPVAPTLAVRRVRRRGTARPGPPGARAHPRQTRTYRARPRTPRPRHGGAGAQRPSAGRDGLQGAEFLYETRLFPEAEYTFKHALTHEVAYAGLVLERRRAVHARIVEAIEQVHAGRLDEQIEALAHHTFRAERWAPATRLLRQAGDRARERWANREAANLYEQALVALSHASKGPDRAREALEIRAWLRLALIPLAEFRTVLPHLEAMDADATALGDERWLALIMAWRGECLRAGASTPPPRPPVSAPSACSGPKGMTPWIWRAPASSSP